jgi:hypothetical protein
MFKSLTEKEGTTPLAPSPGLLLLSFALHETSFVVCALNQADNRNLFLGFFMLAAHPVQSKINKDS